MGNAQAVKNIKRTYQASVTAVQAVVVGGQENIKSGITDSLCIRIGRAELRVAGVGRSAQCGLKIADSNIGCLNLGLDQSETAVVAISSVGL